VYEACGIRRTIGYWILECDQGQGQLIDCLDLDYIGTIIWLCVMNEVRNHRGSFGAFNWTN
jgi:hypothetical protein